MFTRLVLPALAPALALALAAPLAAEPASVTVAYSDLDLTKDAGRTVLDRRLARAARQVCGVRHPRDLASLADHNRCMVAARASYQPQVELALKNANARRVAVLADKLALIASF